MGKYEDRKWSGEKGKKFGRVDDPYQLSEGQEAAVCSTCQAIYQNKRWFFDEALHRRLAGTVKGREVICPTCRKIKDHYPEGILTLSGDFFKEHRQEILTLLENEAARVGARSVQDRIMQMLPEGKDRLIVETTSEKLAQHLGRAVYRAYKGDLDFRWSEMNKFVRVYWSR
jgi:NMD protein affecting ribosome stability and mRNA decay